MIQLILLSLFLFQAFSSSKLSSLLPELEEIIEKSKQNIWAEIEPEGTHWNMPPWLGSFFLSEYYFELKGTQIDTQPFSLQIQLIFKPNLILKSSLPNY